MKFRILKMSLSLLVVAALAGCAGMRSAPPQPLTFTPQAFESGSKCVYTPKKDNALFILDASLSMGKDGQQNFFTAKNFIGAVSKSLPSDYAGMTGLRSFGHSEMQSKKETELVTPLAKHSRDALQKGLDSVKYTGGNSPLGVAIAAAAADVEKSGGTAVLVIVSDGTQSNMDDVIAAVKQAKAKLGDKLCVNTVWVGDDAVGKKYLDSVVAAAGCGTAEAAAALTDGAAFASYVEKTFLVCTPPPPAPVAKPAPAPAPPAPTPAPAPCKGIVTANLTFDFDKATIKPEMVPVLEEVLKIVNECKAATYKVAGHTCNIGTEEYNQKLSERRAASVVKWLVDHGVAANRLEAVGYGESQPKYDNKKEEGRKLNRRVEFINK